MLNNLFLVFLITLICSLQLIGQDPSYINYDTKDGLPSSEVYDAEIDENGLIWFSTDRGVCSYDGYDFKIYTTSNGLADNTNFNIFKDSQNRFWFTGYSGNITIYEDGQFSPYEHNDSLTNILKGYWVDHVVELQDKSLVLTNHFILEKSVINLTDNQPPRSVQLAAIETSKDRFNFQNIQVTPFENLAIGMRPVTAKLPRFTNIIARYTLDDFYKFRNNWLCIVKDSLVKLNPNGDILQSFAANEKLVKPYIDHSDNLWLIGTESLYFFKDGNLTGTPDIYFKGIQITDILQDFSGNFWISTLKKGIIFVPSFEIKSIPLPAATDNRILSIQKMDNHIFFGNENRKILYFNNDHDYKTFEVNNRYSKQIKHIHFVNDKLYFSGYEAFEKNGQVIVQKSDLVEYNFGRSLKSGDNIFFVERGFSVFFKRGDKRGYDKVGFGQNYFLSVEFDKPFVHKTTTIAQSENEDLWVATLSGLFQVMNTYSYDEIQPYRLSKGESFGRVNDIQPDQHNNIWIGTIGKGLYYANPKQNKNYKVDRLNSDLINSVLIQNDTTLWVGTNKGVNVVNFETKGDSIRVNSVRNLTTNDGLISNFINDIEYWDDHIYLATNKGICYFPPSITEKSHDPVPIQINELIVNDSTYSVKADLEFKYNQNDLFIHFTGLNFRKNKQNDFYKYRLIQDGNEADWFYTNEKNIRYNNLNAGNYLFEVNAQNNASEWNKVPAKLYFNIHPHFSQTLWFKILIALLLFGVIGLIFRSQSRRIRRQEEANRILEQAQLRIREAELSALRNQMNPHFVYNALNSIQNFIYKKDIEKANYYLVKFSRLMRSSLNFSRLDLISIKEELVFLNDYIELEKMRFPDKFICKSNIEDDLPVDGILIPSLLLQPILENVVKHAFKDIKYLGELVVNFSQLNEHQLKIVIEDNGPGLPSEKIKTTEKNTDHKSLGLEIIKNRINLINERDSSNQSSITFINKDNDSTGLQVIFILPLKYI